MNLVATTLIYVQESNNFCDMGESSNQQERASQDCALDFLPQSFARLRTTIRVND
jgi:hypothetical protein